MTWTRSVLTVAMLCVVGGGPLAAQDPPGEESPRGQRRRHPRRHGSVPRAAAPTATAWTPAASAAPDITQVWASGRTDDGLFKTIKGGVPSTEMPANPRMHDHEAWQILAYLRTLAAPGPDRSAARQRRERRTDLPRALRQLPSRERRRRTPRPRPVARRRRALARRDGAADSPRPSKTSARDTNRSR